MDEREFLQGAGSAAQGTSPGWLHPHTVKDSHAESLGEKSGIDDDVIVVGRDFEALQGQSDGPQPAGECEWSEPDPDGDRLLTYRERR